MHFWNVESLKEDLVDGSLKDEDVILYYSWGLMHGS